MSDKTKEARLQEVTNLFDGIRYPTVEHKQKVIESLVSSGVDIELVRSITNDLKRSQGLHHEHYH
jgi:hypothetical protein